MKKTYSAQLKNIDPRLIELLKDTPPEKFEKVIKEFSGKVHNLQDWANLTASLEETKDKLKEQEAFLYSLYRVKRFVFLFTPIFIGLGALIAWAGDLFVKKFLAEKIGFTKAGMDYLMLGLFFGAIFNVAIGLTLSGKVAFLFRKKEIVNDPLVTVLLEFFTPSHKHDVEATFFTTKDLRRLLFQEKEVEIGGRALWARLEKHPDFARAQGTSVGKGRGLFLKPLNK